MVAFAKILRDRVRDEGKTTAEIADDLGVNVRTLNNYMTGKRAPRLDQLVALSDYFGISLDALVCGRKEPYKGPPTIVLAISDPILETAIELVERGLANLSRPLPANKKAALIVSVLEYLYETPESYSQATINNMICLAA